ncbi:kinase-like domain-containing protein, partial [Gigaspora rosea]
CPCKIIGPNELTEPYVPSKKKPPIKKFYGTIEIECKQMHLAILEQLDSPYIHRFYDICRGLVFLHSVNILHHDIRCENVLVSTHNLDPKLGNFRYARTVEGAEINLSHLATIIICWMAPELLINYVEKRYDENLGILIWELCYEKLSYKDWDFKKISEHVLRGEREKLPYRKFYNQNDVKIQKEFIEIIKKTWQPVPEDRITITKLYFKLEKLAAEYPISPAEPILLTKGTLDLEGENADTSSPDLMDLEKNEDGNLECSSYGDDSNNDSNNNSKKDIKGKNLKLENP